MSSSAQRRAASDPLLTEAEVAAVFGVDVTTVRRWAKAGKLTPIRMLTGGCRFAESEIRSLISDGSNDNLTYVPLVWRWAGERTD